MNMPLVYLDQNVVSLQLDGKIDLSRVTSAQFVYSKEHFAEIRRADDPVPFLRTLDELSARLLDIEMVNWELTGRAILLEVSAAEEHYQRYLNATNDVAFDTNLMNPFFAWVCGGGTEELLRELPEVFFDQLQGLLANVPEAMTPQLLTDLKASFHDMIESMIGTGNNIEDLREQFGLGKGAAGNITGDNPLQQLWDRISPRLPGITIDQFFGFNPLADGQTTPLTWQGIIGCCTVLDIVGYKAEGKKTRNVEKIPNVFSDAVHIATGAYCAAIISHDRRLTERARAIYEFRKINTEALRLELLPDRSPFS